MSMITIVRPDGEVPEVASVALAPRVSLPENPVIGLIANGKPLAGELLHALAAELEIRTGKQFEVEVLSKPSAGHSIDLGEAQRMAARCHVVISGLGD
jgi:hypothetical protein